MLGPMDMTGKHILITGGSSGIGRQCAVQASRLGAHLTLIARNEDGLRETIGLTEQPEAHTYYPFDLQDTAGIEALVKEIVAARGAVDGLCHAAGIGISRTVKMTRPACVEKLLRIHAYAFIELVRCLSLRQNLNHGASLVGISSVAAEKGNISQGAYASAKACMNGFIGPAAKELAPKGIRVNTVAFGMVDTALYQDLVDIGGDLKVMERQYLGVIDKESAANAILFLLSDACRFITGSVLPVYAGY